MLRIRLHHLILAFLLHAGGVIGFWWGNVAIPKDVPARPAAGTLVLQPLPQRLVMPPLVSPPDPALERTEAPAVTTPTSYAAEPLAAEAHVPQLPPHPALSPVGGEDKGEGAGAASTAPGGNPSEPPTAPELPSYASYVEHVLRPAIGDPSLNGLRAPRYLARALGDELIRDLVQRGYGRIVAHVGLDFFLVEEVDGHPGLRRIAELPGYAGRGLPLRSALTESIVRALRREYGFPEHDMLVVFIPSAAFDRLILAKQVLAAQQLHSSLTEIDTTEGRLVRS
ncbi:MAG: hypothetical protein ACREOH_24070, partial [Candidatus Entotheonellia bacterium]